MKAFEVTLTVTVIAEDAEEALEYVDNECRFMIESSLSDCPSTKGYQVLKHAEYTGGDERMDTILYNLREDARVRALLHPLLDTEQPAGMAPLPEGAIVYADKNYLKESNDE